MGDQDGWTRLALSQASSDTLCAHRDCRRAQAARAQEQKALGNDAMRRQQYALAFDHYTVKNKKRGHTSDSHASSAKASLSADR